MCIFNTIISISNNRLHKLEDAAKVTSVNSVARPTRVTRADQADQGEHSRVDKGCLEL